MIAKTTVQFNHIHIQDKSIVFTASTKNLRTIVPSDNKLLYIIDIKHIVESKV